MFIGSYLATADVGTDSITVNWTSLDPFLHLQLQLIEVMVTSGCPSDVARQIFVFNVTSHTTTSITIPGLGIRKPFSCILVY